ncbi:MAG: site-specific DNA-methyltransferase [Candidatus Bathyarchaeota archaeon]|nr:site-specific DNA-methyltransferase [Candidatus Bathyarchaeota archaeon]
MQEVQDGSLHFAVTSPPYVTSKFKKGQPFDYESYLAMVKDVFCEVYRVLTPDARFCLNVGDVHTKYYYKSSRFLRLPVSSHLLQICLDLGFRLLDTFVWDKGFNRYKGGAPGPFFGSYPYPPTIYNNVYWEYIFVLIKPGPKRKVPKEIKEESKLSLAKWREYVQRIWRVESESEWIKEHPSVFSVEIPKRFIEMYSFYGDTVLDPFLGSGTTTLAARLTGRNSIGYEINPKYLDLIKKRAGIEQTSLSDEDKFEIVVRDDAHEEEWV